MFGKLKQYIKEKKHPYYTKDNKKYKNFEIGAYTYGKPSIAAEKGMLTIGKFCSIAAEVVIYAGAEHQINWVTTYYFGKFHDQLKEKQMSKSKGKVTIGNDVWIGHGALILSGVSIGDGAVIGARAVVTKDVKPYEIVAGNPARHIRYRFSQNQIEKLLKIKWWDWDIEKIKANFDLLLQDDIDKFIDKFYKK